MIQIQTRFFLLNFCLNLNNLLESNQVEKNSPVICFGQKQFNNNNNNNNRSIDWKSYSHLSTGVCSCENLFCFIFWEKWGEIPEIIGEIIILRRRTKQYKFQNLPNFQQTKKIEIPGYKTKLNKHSKFQFRMDH